MNKYSIILPVRNGGEYIKECILSILAQTLQNFNLIVLENYSTDDTQQWIESLNDERIIIIPAEKPLSMEDNWARIRTVKRNEFMTMIGADDLLFPNYLEIIDGLITKHPDASLYQSHFNFINEEGNIIRTCGPMREVETVLEFLDSICYNRINIMGTGFMMRSADYDAVGGIPIYPSLLFADFELWLELTRIKYKATSSQTTFAYRVHTRSTTASTPYISYAAGFEKLINYFKVIRKKDLAIEKFMLNNFKAFLNYYCKGNVHRLLKTPVNKRGGLNVNSVINKFKEYALLLMPGKIYQPTKVFSILLAKFIDNNIVTRNAFLIFIKIYKKPLLK